MDPEGILFLVDPFHLGRFPLINATKCAAHATVHRSRNGNVVWIRQFSHSAVAGWSEPLDFVFIDGDHTYEGVRTDWDDWHGYVQPEGILAFHDVVEAPEGGSPSGPWRVVEEVCRANTGSGWHIIDEIGSLVVARRDT
jgi:predicted O-methyltransferase YrrM